LETRSNKCNTASIQRVSLGVLLQSWNQIGWVDASVRFLRPFSWDAKNRAFETIESALVNLQSIVLVTGPYATSDASAWNLDPELNVGFPVNEKSDGILYTIAGEPAVAGQRYQDAAG